MDRLMRMTMTHTDSLTGGRILQEFLEGASYLVPDVTASEWEEDGFATDAEGEEPTPTPDPTPTALRR